MISIKWYELEPFNLLGWLGQESHKILSTHGRLLFFRVKGVDQNDQILRVMFIRRERLSANFLSSLWCEVALSCAKFFRTSCEHLTWGLGQLMRATEFNRWWMFELGEIAKTCVSFSFRVRDFQTKHVGQVAKNWALFHSTCFPNPKMETDHEYGLQYRCGLLNWCLKEDSTVKKIRMDCKSIKVLSAWMTFYRMNLYDHFIFCCNRQVLPACVTSGFLWSFLGLFSPIFRRLHLLQSMYYQTFSWSPVKQPILWNRPQTKTNSCTCLIVMEDVIRR